LTSFLEDVALATDFDSKKENDKPSISLMTIHQSKGLEYSHVYVVGLEENLFPSAMSMNTRSELEEERRLFYVAITRAEKVAYLSYAQTRYRWGKLVDAEPSRFLEEIDEQYLHYITPKTIAPTINRFVDKSLFEDAPKGIRFQKPIQRKKTARDLAKKKEIILPKNLKKVSQTAPKGNLFDNDIIVGNIIEHERFGRGEVISLEGKGPDKKAMIQFGTAGKKNLLLCFVKLKIIG
jgi:DNA helicase-2/ATP-dependent DNA helicase PcrA